MSNIYTPLLCKIRRFLRENQRKVVKVFKEKWALYFILLLISRPVHRFQPLWWVWLTVTKTLKFCCNCSKHILRVNKQTQVPHIYSVLTAFVEDLKYQFNYIITITVLFCCNSLAQGNHSTMFASTILFPHSYTEALFCRYWMDFWLNTGQWRMSNKVMSEEISLPNFERNVVLFLVCWVNSWEK